jgi:DUF4097 and DUF4098 domain-containing protein YvlB
MNRNRLSLPRPGFLATLASVLLAWPMAAQSETVDTVHKSFTVEPGGRLVVDVAEGALDVTTTAGKELTVEVVSKVAADSKEREQQFLKDHAVTFDQSSGTVTIRSTRPASSRSIFDFWRRGVRADVRFTIATPERFNVDLKTAGGAVKVTGVTGDVHTETSGGGLQFAQITGPIHGATSGGSIHLDACAGAAKIHTSGGGISVHAHRGDLSADTNGGGITLDGITGNVTASTSGGGIHATWLASPTAESRLSTSGGSVSVMLPEKAAVDLDAATSGGSVRSDFSVDGTRRASSLKGRINGGGPLLYLRTSGGGVRVTSARQSAALPR